ncbi:ABC transporter ATP-binding protein [Oscillospiraceae bacterium HV4-5-C5C]|nr:ABC transporter ATP-binding protein [Oscillospiraceae bacterium HV4-5-C5C]
MTQLCATQLSKSYHNYHNSVQAIKHVSLSVATGESVAIIGPSGSGKSTLLNLLGLVIQPDEGHVKLDNLEVSNLSDSKLCRVRNTTFGYVFQDFALLDHLTVYENIRIPLIYRREIPRRTHRQRIRAAAEALGIADKLHRHTDKLSGGERQRVAIARAIACDQSILLADEPTGSLDQDNKDTVMTLLMRLCREKNKSLIIVTHDLTIAQQCDRVVQLQAGHLVAEANYGQ